MAAYIIVDIEITDPEAYERYKPMAAASVKKHGGRFLVRGGKVATLEGGWTPSRIVVLEFPTVEAAKQFYHSEDYAPAIKLRQSASKGRMILVEGAPPA
jgi:uncharacterized protein (DUF1330 family)